MSVNVTIQNSSGERETYNLSILDLVKYATKVIIKVLEPFDRLSIVSYNSSASVLLDSCLMTAQGKTDAEAVLDFTTTLLFLDFWTIAYLAIPLTIFAVYGLTIYASFKWIQKKLS